MFLLLIVGMKFDWERERERGRHIKQGENIFLNEQRLPTKPL